MILENRAIIGALSGLAGAIAFAVMGLAVQLAPLGMPSSQLLAARGAGAILLLGIAGSIRWKLILHYKARHLWARSLAGTLGISCFFWTLRHESIATATILADMCPVFVCLLGATFAKQWPAWNALAACALSFVGIIFVSELRFDFQQILPIGVGLLGALFAAFAYTALHEAAKIYSAAEIVFCLSVGLMAVGFASHDGWISVRNSSALGVLGVIISSLVAQMLMTVSFKYLSAFQAALISATGCVWAALIDNWIFGRVFGVYEVIGYVMVVGASMLVKADEGSLKRRRIA